MIRDYLTVVFLAVMMGVSYELFVFPNAFAPAGLNGLATMVQYVFHVNIGYVSLLVNLPLIFLAWRALNPDYARKSLLYVLVFSGVTLALGGWISPELPTAAAIPACWGRWLPGWSAEQYMGGLSG